MTAIPHTHNLLYRLLSAGHAWLPAALRCFLGASSLPRAPDLARLCVG
jgi:hypothetical protein